MKGRIKESMYSFIVCYMDQGMGAFDYLLPWGEFLLNSAKNDLFSSTVVFLVLFKIKKDVTLLQ